MIASLIGGIALVRDNEKTDFSITTKIPFLSEDRSIDGANDVQSNSFTYEEIGSSIKIDKVSVTDDAVYFHLKMKKGYSIPSLLNYR